VLECVHKKNLKNISGTPDMKNKYSDSLRKDYG
jgi:hypothetical protein